MHRSLGHEFVLLPILLMGSLAPALAQQSCDPEERWANLRENARERMLFANAELVALTAEQAYVEDGIEYELIAPVQQRLPGRQLLVNSWTLARTEPSMAIAALPGQVGYDLVVNSEAINSGFSVTGFGRRNEVLFFAGGFFPWWVDSPAP